MCPYCEDAENTICIHCYRNSDIDQPYTPFLFNGPYVGKHRFNDPDEVDPEYFLDDVAYNEDLFEASLDSNTKSKRKKRKNDLNKAIKEEYGCDESDNLPKAIVIGSFIGLLFWSAIIYIAYSMIYGSYYYYFQ